MKNLQKFEHGQGVIEYSCILIVVVILVIVILMVACVLPILVFGGGSAWIASNWEAIKSGDPLQVGCAAVVIFMMFVTAISVLKSRIRASS